MRQQMSKTLPCGITVSGDVHALVQLSAKFQIKARAYKLDYSESLAVWIEGDKAKVKAYFGSRIDDYHRGLDSGKTKLQSAPKIWNL